MKLFPAVLFRHDLDEISSNEFDLLKIIIKQLNIPATFFLLEHQYTKDAAIFFPKAWPARRRLIGWREYRNFISKADKIELGRNVEFALHSEAKPERFENNDIVELYKKNLISQKKKFKNVFGYCPGHSVHSENLTIFAQKIGNTSANRELDTSIINLASSKSGFSWVSCYKDIGHFTKRSIRFRMIAKPYYVGKSMIFPIGWDDNFCYFNFLAKKILSAEKILRSMASRLDQSIKSRIPLVVSLHPMYFLETNARRIYSKEIISRFIEIVKRRRIPFFTFSSYVRNLIKPKTWSLYYE